MVLLLTYSGARTLQDMHQACMHGSSFCLVMHGHHGMDGQHQGHGCESLQSAGGMHVGRGMRDAVLNCA